MTLKGADFSGVDLLGTIFHNCDLCGADFSSSIQYDIDPRTNKITKAKFSLPEATGDLMSRKWEGNVLETLTICWSLLFLIPPLFPICFTFHI
jgi:hypothetical protein